MSLRWKGVRHVVTSVRLDAHIRRQHRRLKTPHCPSSRLPAGIGIRE